MAKQKIKKSTGHKQMAFSDDTLDTAVEGGALIEWAGSKTGTGKGAAKGYTTWSTTSYKPCYETHPPLPLGNGLVVYGGNCSTPIVTDADVYVGLDYSMKPNAKMPWEAGPRPIDVYFRIADMAAPADPVQFVKLIGWLAEQITAGKKVHVGCIGGHGRTGMVLAALAKVMLGEEAAIAYVRKAYCKKAVETAEQVDFLHKVFGIKKASASKLPTYAWGTTDTGGSKLQTSWPCQDAAFCMWGKGARRSFSGQKIGSK